MVAAQTHGSPMNHGMNLKAIRFTRMAPGFAPVTPLACSSLIHYRLSEERCPDAPALRQDPRSTMNKAG
jgi:hypothetical protein